MPEEKNTCVIFASKFSLLSLNVVNLPLQLDLLVPSLRLLLQLLIVGEVLPPTDRQSDRLLSSDRHSARLPFTDRNSDRLYLHTRIVTVSYPQTCTVMSYYLPYRHE
jgi:hypothetical protein